MQMPLNPTLNLSFETREILGSRGLLNVHIYDRGKPSNPLIPSETWAWKHTPMIFKWINNRLVYTLVWDHRTQTLCRQVSQASQRSCVAIFHLVRSHKWERVRKQLFTFPLKHQLILQRCSSDQPSRPVGLRSAQNLRSRPCLFLYPASC